MSSVVGLVLLDSPFPMTWLVHDTVPSPHIKGFNTSYALSVMKHQAGSISKLELISMYKEKQDQHNSNIFFCTA